MLRERFIYGEPAETWRPVFEASIRRRERAARRKWLGELVSVAILIALAVAVGVVIFSGAGQ